MLRLFCTMRIIDVIRYSITTNTDTNCPTDMVPARSSTRQRQSMTKTIASATGTIHSLTIVAQYIVSK